MKTNHPPLERAAPVAAPFRSNILIVDDRPANLIALEAALEPLGQRLVRAVSGEEALRRLREEDFAVILMDIRMPGMDGLRTTELIKQTDRSARVPIIFITAVALERSDLVGAYARGAVDFILKPFDPDILKSKVSVFVDLYLKEQTIKRQAAQLHQREREAFERRSEKRFKMLIDSMPMSVWTARTDGHFHFWNKSAAAYTGMSVGSEPVPYSRLIDSVHPEDRVELGKNWETIVAFEREFEAKFRIRRVSDGAYRWHLGRAIPQRDEAGMVNGWIFLATDIDGEQQALEKAETASRIKDDFLATVSHELRNPLNAIKGWTYLLRSGTLDQARVSKALEVIERNVDLQASLVDDMLDVSRIIEGRLKINFDSLHMIPIVEAALGAIRPTADAKELQIECNFRAPADDISGDADRLQQVVWNLLSNAVKFSPRGSRITIELNQVDDVLQLAVRDTGEGISPAFLPFVFERFRQADSSTTRIHRGLGLGLAIVRHLVELHGGTVRAESDGEGRGATFSIILPTKNQRFESQPSSNQSQRLRRSLEGVSVMVVEDQQDSRELIAEALEYFGAQVTTASSCREALEQLAQKMPRFLLSDIGMPGEDGFDLIAKLRQNESAARTIKAALTGFGSAEDQKRVLDAGFDACFIKPVNIDQLVSWMSDRSA
jgi:PAS domain S-box-containing protein